MGPPVGLNAKFKGVNERRNRLQRLSIVRLDEVTEAADGRQEAHDPQGTEEDHQARAEEEGDVRGLVAVVQSRKHRRKVPVAAQGEQDARAGAERHAEGRQAGHDRREDAGPPAPSPEQIVRHEDKGRARFCQVLVRHDTHHHPQHQHVDGNPDPERDEDGPGDVARRIDDFLRRHRDEVESHVRDVNEAHRGNERPEPHRGERVQVGRLHLKGPEQPDADQHDELDHVHHRDDLQGLGLSPHVGERKHDRRGHNDEKDAGARPEVRLNREREDDGVKRAGQRVVDPEKPARQKRDGGGSIRSANE